MDGVGPSGLGWGDVSEARLSGSRRPDSTAYHAGAVQASIPILDRIASQPLRIGPIGFTPRLFLGRLMAARNPGIAGGHGPEPSLGGIVDLSAIDPGEGPWLRCILPTASGAGLQSVLDANLAGFDPRVADEIRLLAKEVLPNG